MHLPGPEIFGIWLQSRLPRTDVEISLIETFISSGRVPLNLLSEMVHWIRGLPQPDARLEADGP
jgi:hypothetical protein